MSEEKEGSGIDFSAIKIIRQLSIPMWARIFALVVAFATFVGSIWLMGIGTIFCHGDCNDKLLELGVSILAGTFVPMIVLIYIAFARTGIEALKKKTEDFLLETIPSIFNRQFVPWNDDIEFGISDCSIIPSRPIMHVPFYEKFWRGIRNKGYIGSSSERYLLRVKWGGYTNTDVQFFVELNMYKINVGMLLPIQKINPNDQSKNPRKFFEDVFGSVFEGAKHEGYKVDDNVSVTNKYYYIVSRLKVPEDFIWDPSHQLHFIQDLKNFILAFAHCWCNYVYSGKSDDVKIT